MRWRTRSQVRTSAPAQALRAGPGGGAAAHGAPRRPAVASMQRASCCAGVSNGQLNLSPAVLASIYQCNTTFWDDPMIAALNLGVQLPHVNITPVAYTEDVGVTQIFLQYVQLDGTWSLGTGTNFAAPPCVQHASLWTGVLARLQATPSAIGCAPGRSLALLPTPMQMGRAMAGVRPARARSTCLLVGAQVGDGAGADAAARARARYIEYRRVLRTNVTTSALRNAAGAYVAPAFHQVAVPPNALPTSLASPDWERVQLTSYSAPCL